MSYRDCLFEAAPVCVRFYGAIGPEHEGFRRGLYKRSNLAFYLCWGTSRNDAMAIHASHKGALEAAADLMRGKSA